jgi:hypothetical protein
MTAGRAGGALCGLVAGLFALTPGTGAAAGRGDAPLPAAKLALVRFHHTPFPYRGMIPEQDKPFLDVLDDRRRGHTSARGGIYWEDETYNDRRVLVFLPKGFDLRRPAVIVVFFHGNGATLERDVVARQQVADQLSDSGLNAVLLAPQFAVDAQDSSAGNFWTPDFFRQFLDEASEKIAELWGSSASRGTFARLPVVLVVYSGGYNPAAYVLAGGGAGKRVLGVVLLDAIYAEEDKFAEWIARHRRAFFFSAYSKSSKDGNANLERLLAAKRIAYSEAAPAKLMPGTVTFLAADADADGAHDDFLTKAWVARPVQWVLSRVHGFGD